MLCWGSTCSSREYKKVSSSKHQLRVQMLIVHASKTSFLYFCVPHFTHVHRFSWFYGTYGRSSQLQRGTKNDQLTEIEKPVDRETYRFILYIWSDINNKMHVCVVCVSLSVCVCVRLLPRLSGQHGIIIMFSCLTCIYIRCMRANIYYIWFYCNLLSTDRAPVRHPIDTHRQAGRQAKELSWTALLVGDKIVLWPIYLKKPILLGFLRVPLFWSPFYYCCKWSTFITASIGYCLLKHSTIYAKRLMSCFGSTILLPLFQSVHRRLFLQYLFSQCLQNWKLQRNDIIVPFSYRPHTLLGLFKNILSTLFFFSKLRICLWFLGSLCTPLHITTLYYSDMCCCQIVMVEWIHATGDILQTS